MKEGYTGADCPVCGGKTFGICETCGWIHNWYQIDYPDEGGLENLYSLNAAKKLWKETHRNIGELAREAVLAKRKQMQEEQEGE